MSKENLSNNPFIYLNFTFGEDAMEEEEAMQGEADLKKNLE